MGITDHLQLGVYVFDWQYNRKDEESHDLRWQHSGIELIYSLSNPTTDFLGSALYAEALAREDSLELEWKLLLQKNIGPLRVAYNAILEAQREGDKFGHFEERNGEFAQTLAISYDINKNFSVGTEVLHEIRFLTGRKPRTPTFLWVRMHRCVLAESSLQRPRCFRLPTSRANRMHRCA